MANQESVWKHWTPSLEWSKALLLMIRSLRSYRMTWTSFELSSDRSALCSVSQLTSRITSAWLKALHSKSVLMVNQSRPSAQTQGGSWFDVSLECPSRNGLQWIHLNAGSVRQWQSDKHCVIFDDVEKSEENVLSLQTQKQEFDWLSDFLQIDLLQFFSWLQN